MKLIIESIDNGYILKTYEIDEEEEEESVYRRQGFVWDEDEGENGEYEAIQALLYTVLDELKPNSKHNTYRIDIEIKENNKE